MPNSGENVQMWLYNVEDKFDFEYSDGDKIKEWKEEARE